MLARPPDQVTVIDVLGAIREPPSSRDVEPPAVPTPVAATLRRRDDAVRDALGSVSLRALATSTPEAWHALPANRDRAA
jgi:DNA-binding IscR family transcriptional regulator